MEKNWTLLDKYTNDIRAEMIRQLLAENEIPSVITNKQDSSFLFGGIEIHVPNELLAQAQEIVKNFHAEDAMGDSDED